MVHYSCRTLGIALFTVSHRRTLWRHHEFVLYFDGRGDYRFERITPEVEDQFANMK
jgi:ATP-binding cassette subfamily D (ALD) protein 3